MEEPGTANRRRSRGRGLPGRPVLLRRPIADNAPVTPPSPPPSACAAAVFSDRRLLVGRGRRAFLLRRPTTPERRRGQPDLLVHFRLPLDYVQRRGGVALRQSAQPRILEGREGERRMQRSRRVRVVVGVGVRAAPVRAIPLRCRGGTVAVNADDAVFHALLLLPPLSSLSVLGFRENLRFLPARLVIFVCQHRREDQYHSVSPTGHLATSSCGRAR
mmetsp:Transcript_27493/g.80844  ORF Transcript_27493/g.80844 Transcript_27493/m.80844 type:complete len:217 (-) Transcript_27493:88-738(-)